jgi:hypothetical protein
MALLIPEYPNPYSTTPATNAIGWVSFIALDASKPAVTGRVVININQDEASANAYLSPLGQVNLSLGQVLVAEVPDVPEVVADPESDPPIEGVPAVPGTPAVMFPTFAELMADSEFASAFEVIKAKLYAAALASPELPGAVIV